MTIIAALHAEGQTWIGADSLCTFGNERSQAPAEKWVVRWDGRVAVGFSGHSRAGMVARRSLFGATKSDDAWEVAQALRSILDADGWKPVDGDGAKRHDVNLVFASLTEVALVDMAFAVHQMPDGVPVMGGSGSGYAEGAAYAMRGQPARDVVCVALEAACRFDTSCGGDLFIQKLEPKA